MFGKDRLKKTIWVILVQILFERCSKCFEDILQKFENFGSKVCNNLHLETEHFWLWIRIKFDFQNKIWKLKGLSWLQKCISKRSLPKWFKRVENYLIWFNSPKVLFPKRTWTCVLSLLFDFKRNGNWNLTFFISKVVLKLIWFDFRNPKGVHLKWFENKVWTFHLFSKMLKIHCLKHISKEPELICLLFIWDLIIKSSFQKSLKNKA